MFKVRVHVYLKCIQPRIQTTRVPYNFRVLPCCAFKCQLLSSDNYRHLHIEMNSFGYVIQNLKLNLSLENCPPCNDFDEYVGMNMKN